MLQNRFTAVILFRENHRGGLTGKGAMSDHHSMASHSFSVS